MNDRLHFAFFGPSVISTFWNGEAAYHRGVLRALAERGHRITIFEAGSDDRQRHRDLPEPDWAEVVVYPVSSRWSVLNTIEAACDVDVVIKTSGVGFHDNTLEAGLLELKPPQTLAVFWDRDAPTTVDRLARNATDPLRPLLRCFDLVLTAGGAASIAASYEVLGAVRCLPLYNALDPESHFPVADDPRYAADLALLGHRLPDRDQRVAEFFLRAAELRPARKFLLGGDGWEDCPLPRNVRRLGRVGREERNAFHATPTAVLVLDRASLASYGDAPPTRLFEAAGAAACVITNAWAGVEKFLAPGTEVLVARDGADVAAHLDALDAARAAALGRAARQRLLAQHTFAHRAAQLEEALAEGAHDHGPAPVLSLVRV